MSDIASWDREEIWRAQHGFNDPPTHTFTDNNETRITSPTGGQKGQKSSRLGGADPLALMELAEVYGMGEGKYDRYNYLKGYAWSLSVDAMFRHLLAFLAGEDRDKESGLLHTAHAAWHALTLTSYTLRGIGEDDRAPVHAPMPVNLATAGVTQADLDALYDSITIPEREPNAEWWKP